MEVTITASTDLLTFAGKCPASFAAFESEPDAVGWTEMRPAKKQTAPNTIPVQITNASFGRLDRAEAGDIWFMVKDILQTRLDFSKMNRDLAIQLPSSSALPLL